MAGIVRQVTNARRGRCVIFNGTVFLGGQVADDRSQDAGGQMAQALAKIDRCLAEAGTDRDHLLTAQIWLKDIARDFAAMNVVWDAWSDPDAAPARATVQCELGAADALVEIMVTAAIQTV